MQPTSIVRPWSSNSGTKLVSKRCLFVSETTDHEDLQIKKNPIRVTRHFFLSSLNVNEYLMYLPVNEV